MFYAQYVLNKKGPLARIWLAAHWDKKLTKANVFETNIEKSVDGILQPKVKLALRTTGHLMLGVVRIYSKKEKYLLADCNEAFVKIKMAFRPGMVDLPEEKREAAVNAITLPEVFHDFDTAMPELNDVDIQAQFSFNQSRAEEITMREDYGNISLVTGDDGFGDMGFDAEPPELMRDANSLEPSIENSNMLFDGSGAPKPESAPPAAETSQQSTSKQTPAALELDAPIRDDGFGGNLGQDIMAGGLFDGGLFDDPPMPNAPPPPPPAESPAPPGALDDHHSDDDFDHHMDASPMGGGHSSDDSRPSSPVPAAATPAPPPEPGAEAASVPDAPAEGLPPPPPPPPPAEPDMMEPPPHEQTTLLQNEEETFALPPVDASAIRAAGVTRSKRKRKLIVDEVKNISGEEMKTQLSDTADIVTSLDLAPPTKRLMHWKETGGVEKLFALPGRTIPAAGLSKMYMRHLTSRPAADEDGDEAGAAIEDEEQPVPEKQLPARATRGRLGKRKREPEPEEDPASVAAAAAMEQQAAAEAAAEAQAAAAAAQTTPDAHVEPPHSVPPQSVPPAPEELEEPAPETPAVPLTAATPAPPTVEQQPESVMTTQAAVEPPTNEQPPPIPHMENMGYDQQETSGGHLANMGYDENIAPPVTPGAVSDRGPMSVYSNGPATPWEEDQEQASVQPEDGQQEGETYEQYEDRVNNKRAAVMHRIIKSKFELSDKLQFSELCRRNNRKQVAQKFYTTLVLKKLQVLELEQESSYADLILTQGPKFTSVQL